MIENQSNEDSEVDITLSAVSHNTQQIQQISKHQVALSLQKGLSEHTIVYSMGEHPLLWNEFDPNLYKLHITLSDAKDKILDTRENIFGMREIEAKYKQLYLNGRKVFLRGNPGVCHISQDRFPSYRQKGMGTYLYHYQGAWA